MERAAVLAPVLAWSKTAARYPQNAGHIEWILEHSEPLVHWVGATQPLLEELLIRWMETPQAVLEAHQVEYTRLFVACWGGVPAPLYASWYLDGESFHGRAAETAMRFYERWGVLWRQTELREPPDHLAVELEFLEMLCRVVASSPKNRSPDAAAATDLWHDFRRHHFDFWVPRCVEAMERHARMPIYRVLALSLAHLGEEG